MKNLIPACLMVLTVIATTSLAMLVEANTTESVDTIAKADSFNIIELPLFTEELKDMTADERLAHMNISMQDLQNMTDQQLDDLLNFIDQ